MTMTTTMDEEYVWRFGYGSNIGLKTLQEKKNLNPIKYAVGTIRGYELLFFKALDYVEPAFAGVRPAAAAASDDDGEQQNNVELHGSAFLIPKVEADGLDKQESGYNVIPCSFTSYDGEVIDNVGLYVPKNFNREEGKPSLRYLRLLQNGARDGKLSKEWIQKLESVEYYITPSNVRTQTQKWIDEFHNNNKKKDNRNNHVVLWDAETLAKHDGSDVERYPTHCSVMEYVVKIDPKQFVFSSWKGHNITRRNLLHFQGKSVDKHDIRFHEPGYRPLPKLSSCSDEEKEYLLQNLERLLHQGGTIVGQYQPYLEDQTK